MQPGKNGEHNACFSRQTRGFILQCRSGAMQRQALALPPLAMTSADADSDAGMGLLRSAVRSKPGDMSALVRLGAALFRASRPSEALVALRSAVALNPGNVEARVQLGALLCAIEDYPSAITQLQAAAELDAGCVPARYNLGCAWLGAGRYEAAADVFTSIADRHPGLAVARFNRALAWLSAGDFKRGLPEYEWRLPLIHQYRASYPPRWNGSALGRKTLLVHAEQGLGDTLHFLRFVPQALALAPHMALQVQTALLPLLAPLAARWGIALHDLADTGVDADVSCPLPSLPLALCASLDQPPPSPRPHAPEAYRRKWHDVFRPARGRRRIGIAWSGNRRPYDVRAIDVQALASLFSMGDVEWVVLQKQLSPIERQYLTAPPHAGRVLLPADQIADMADTAAIIEHLDAVVSIDTSIAHLAGAMDKPVIVMLPFAADWRWRIDGQNSRWYPSATLIRQDEPGGWDGVIRRVAQVV